MHAYKRSLEIISGFWTENFITLTYMRDAQKAENDISEVIISTNQIVLRTVKYLVKTIKFSLLRSVHITG